jgi:hypothetical protein
MRRPAVGLDDQPLFAPDEVDRVALDAAVHLRCGQTEAMKEAEHALLQV